MFGQDYKTFGATDANLANFITTHTLTQWAIIIVAVVIVISGISHVYGQRLVPITKDGDKLCIEYNGGSHRFVKYTRNMVTREHVGLLLNGKVITNLLYDEDDIYDHSQFDTINGINIISNTILFDQLELEL